MTMYWWKVIQTVAEATDKTVPLLPEMCVLCLNLHHRNKKTSRKFMDVTLGLAKRPYK